MRCKVRRYSVLSLLSCLMAVLLWVAAATPTLAHWADMAAAEIVVAGTEVQMTLTFPTGLAAFADDDRSGQLSPAEIQNHAIDLQTFLHEKIQISDRENQAGVLTVRPLAQGALPPTVQAAPNTHSTLMLAYSWQKPVQGIKIDYDLFLPGVSTANCLVTILQDGQLKTFVFTPTHPTFSLMPGLPGFLGQGLVLAIAGSFLWGAIHSMSPGHGKTIVGAYLVGSRATPKHALFLAMTTTITHTIGVFALGLITLFAAEYVLPEQLYPWLSLLSGLMVMAIGLKLLLDRWGQNKIWNPFDVKKMLSSTEGSYAYAHGHDQDYSNNRHDHSHDHNPTHNHADHVHGHDQSYGHSHHHLEHTHPSIDHTHDRASTHTHQHKSNHSHDHEHGHDHDHLPPGADGSPVTWRELLALGISGGLVPCPAALVLLLSAIALGNVGFGLVMVLAFSLGLAGVLTGLGLLMVYAKRFFHHVPTHLRLIKAMPYLSASCVAFIGLIISGRALMQVINFQF